MLPVRPVLPSRFFAPPQEVFPAIGPRRARVGLLSGCVMSVLFADLNEATIRVLQRNGCEVVVPRAQTCCAALNLHNGERDRARAMARRNIETFLAAGVDAVIINSAGCGSRSEEHTSELQSRLHLVCRLLLEKKIDWLHRRPYCRSHPHSWPDQA